MGGVPTKHSTHGKVRRRRSHLKIQSGGFIACPKCGAAIIPHRYCPNCGYYAQKEVVDVLAKLSKKEKKSRAQEIKK